MKVKDKISWSKALLQNYLQAVSPLKNRKEERKKIMSGIKSSIIVRKLTQQNDEQHKYRTSAKLEEDSKKKDSFKY